MKKFQKIDNFSHIVTLDQLKRENEYEFNLGCSENSLRDLIEELNLLEAKKASINGTLQLRTEKQILLKCTVRAKLIQACSLTLEPVVTTISKKILRTFSVGSNINARSKKSVFELNEKSFDNDTIINEINLGEVLMETISLELPDYPKKTGASINLTQRENIITEGPFSILSKLKK